MRSKEVIKIAYERAEPLSGQCGIRYRALRGRDSQASRDGSPGDFDAGIQLDSLEARSDAVRKRDGAM